MANIKSAEKRIKQTGRRQQRNRAVRSKLRTAVKKHRESEAKDRKAALPATYAEIDRAVTAFARTSSFWSNAAHES